MGLGKYCSPRHRMPLSSVNEDLKCVGWRGRLGEYCSLCHSLGCHLMTKRGLKVCWMTWRAIYARPYLERHPLVELLGARGVEDVPQADGCRLFHHHLVGVPFLTLRACNCRLLRYPTARPNEERSPRHMCCWSQWNGSGSCKQRSPCHMSYAVFYNRVMCLVLVLVTVAGCVTVMTWGAL